MTSVQVDTAALRAAADRLNETANEVAVAQEQAGRVLNAVVPGLHGSAAAHVSDMLHEALGALDRLGDSDRLLADALNYAAQHAEQLEEILAVYLTPSHGRRPDAAT